MSSFLFSACTFDDLGNEEGGEQPTFFQHYIDSFKVVYSNSLTGEASSVKALEDNFFKKTLGVVTTDENGIEFNGLAYYYGSAKEDAANNPQWFPDSIRMLVINDANTDNGVEVPEGKAELISTSTEDIWNWTFNPSLDSNEIEYLQPRIETVPVDQTYDGWKERLWEENNFTFNYSNTFSNMYLLPLKVVMYEVLLGYDTLTTFGPAEGGEVDGEVAKVKSSSKSSIVGEIFKGNDDSATMEEDELSSEKLKNYISFLREDYKKKNKYVGFTKQNADKMISYILDEVIGKELVAFDYLNYGPSSSNESYFEDIELNKETFKGILKLDSNDDKFNAYIETLKPGDVVYEKSDVLSYNYLVYEGKSGTGSSITYHLKNYYNYRNYIERVAHMIYSQSYDGFSKEFIYEKDIIHNQIKVDSVKYDYVKEYFEEEPGKGSLAPGVEKATAATFFRGYEGEDFFEVMDADFSFENAPKAEYQSIVMITNPKNAFEIEAGMVFNIMAYDKNLKINIKVRYYNADTEKLYEFDSGQTDFATSEYYHGGYVDDFEVGFEDWILAELPDNAKSKNSDGDDSFIIPHVTNYHYKEIARNEEINLGYKENEDEEKAAKAAKAAKYYKIVDSINGYGGITVLDEGKMDSSFYEIVFDIVKSPNDPADMDYDFRVTVSPLIW